MRQSPGEGFLGPTVGSAAFLLTSPRLERAIRAGHKRNAERAPVDLSSFDARAYKSERVRDATVLLLENLYFTEGAGAANLARLACTTPIGSLRSAYGAQMSDEIAHADILRRYLVEALGVRELKEHVVTLAGRRLGMLVQRHPLVGVESITLPIEYYATNLLEAVAKVVNEPALHASLDQIRKDEGRHMVVTTEAVHLLESAGIGTGPFMRMRRKATRAAVTWFTKTFMNGLLRKHCAVLGIPWDSVYDRSMDEIASAVARVEDAALAIEGDAE